MSKAKTRSPAKSRGATRVKLVRPRPVDAHVGARVRLRRTMIGMSQEQLAQALGLTFQQVQKYERGTNRVSASKLYDMSKILDAPVQYFFDEMPAEIDATARTGNGDPALAHADVEHSPFARRETMELVRCYYRIVDPRVRKKVADLARSLATAA